MDPACGSPGTAGPPKSDGNTAWHTESMAAVPVPVTEREIDDRRRLGIDKLDELWAGEWHLVNPPKMWHGLLNEALRDVLRPLAGARGLSAHGDGFGLFAAPNDWRVPDQIYALVED